MDASHPLTDEEAEFLRALEERGVRYLVVGMSAALMQGVPGSTIDIDLWFETLTDERIADAARSAGGFLFVTHMSGLPDFEIEYAGAPSIDLGNATVRVLPLERILVSKRAANRAKDQVAIAQIEHTLALLAATSGTK
jgi:hypothetical protein